MTKPRDYAKEYREYQGTPEQLKNQSTRHKARRKMVAKLGKAAVAGKDVHHVNGIEAGNGHGNLRVMSVKKNRGLK
jgi:hypothetical protein